MNLAPFSPDQADKILRLHHAGIDKPELAARYGCDEKTISDALTGAEQRRKDRRAEQQRKLQGVVA